MKNLLKIRRIQMVIRFRKRKFGRDIRRHGDPGSIQRKNLSILVLRNLLSEFLYFVSYDWLEFRNWLFGEHGIQSCDEVDEGGDLKLRKCHAHGRNGLRSTRIDLDGWSGSITVRGMLHPGYGALLA